MGRITDNMPTRSCLRASPTQGSVTCGRHYGMPIEIKFYGLQQRLKGWDLSTVCATSPGLSESLWPQTMTQRPEAFVSSCPSVLLANPSRASEDDASLQMYSASVYDRHANAWILKGIGAPSRPPSTPCGAIENPNVGRRKCNAQEAERVTANGPKVPSLLPPPLLQPRQD